MAVLKNKTQKNFTMISNNILRDKSLSMKDCGVLCTLCSLPDGWEFSIVGLSATVPDGVDSIRKSITNLEELGYMNRTKSRGSDALLSKNTGDVLNGSFFVLCIYRKLF